MLHFMILVEICLFFFSKSSSDLSWADESDPDSRWLIGQNMNGYWDSPYRYHHKNGYFVNTGGCWEEWQNENLHATFVLEKDLK